MIEDAVERNEQRPDKTTADKEKDEESEHTHAVVELGGLVGEEVAEDVATVERRKRNEVEDEEKQVDEDDEVEKERDGEEGGKALGGDAGHVLGDGNGGGDGLSRFELQSDQLQRRGQHAEMHEYAQSAHQRERDEPQWQQAAEYFRHQLRYVDCALRDGRCYLMGDQFTTADILLTTCLVWAVSYGVEVCESALRYLERTTGRPAYEAARVSNTAPA